MSAISELAFRGRVARAVRADAGALRHARQLAMSAEMRGSRKVIETAEKRRARFHSSCGAPRRALRASCTRTRSFVWREWPSRPQRRRASASTLILAIEPSEPIFK